MKLKTRLINKNRLIFEGLEDFNNNDFTIVLNNLSKHYKIIKINPLHYIVDYKKGLKIEYLIY